MIYYKVKLKYEIADETDEARLIRFWRRADGDCFVGKTYSLFIINRDDTTIDAILMFSVKDYTLSSIKKRVINDFDETGETIKSISFTKTPEEITVTEATSLLRIRRIGGIGGNVQRISKRLIMRWCNAEYTDDNSNIKFEEIVLPHAQRSLSKAKDAARDILADPCIEISKKANNTNINLNWTEFNSEYSSRIKNDGKNTKINEWYVTRSWEKEERGGEYWGT